MPISHIPPCAPHVKTDVFDVAQALARAYVDPATGAIGVPALAAQMGMPSGTLYNKLNPNETTHYKLSLQDVIQITVITGDLRLVKALTQALGCVCFAIPNLDHVSDEALLELINNVGAEGGDFHRAINIALARKRPERRDIGRIRKEGLEFIGAIVEAMTRTEGLLHA
jgi:Phage regulatory protein CII (CP76)